MTLREWENFFFFKWDFMEVNVVAAEMKHSIWMMVLIKGYPIGW